jgi:hypothetical protein
MNPSRKPSINGNQRPFNHEMPHSLIRTPRTVRIKRAIELNALAAALSIVAQVIIVDCSLCSS